jgi:hypothetical protein
MKNKIRKTGCFVALAVIMIFLLQLTACDQRGSVENKNAEVDTPSLPIYEVNTEEQGTENNEEGSERLDEEVYEEKVVRAPADTDRLNDNAVCGNGRCESDENCRDCSDCSCGPDKICYNRVCLKPECSTGDECRDKKECTEDICYFAGHINAYCGTKRIDDCQEGMSKRKISHGSRGAGDQGSGKGEAGVN